MPDYGQKFLQGYSLGQKRNELSLEREKLQQQRQLGQLGQQYLGGDESAFNKIAGINPQMANQLKQLQTEQQKKQQLDLQKGSMLAQTVLDAEPEERAGVYRSTMAVAKQYGIDTTGLPDIWTPETESYLQNVINVASGMKGDQRKFGATPEGYVIDPRKEEIRKLKGFEGTPEDKEKLFKRTGELRKEYTKESGEFIDTRNSFNRIEASVVNPSPAGDVALLYNYMKILDPRSTVREGEFATAKNAGSISETLRAKYNKAMEGTMLTSKMRGDFVNRAEKLYNRHVGTQKKREKQYRNIAKKQGIPEEEAIIDLYKIEQPQANLKQRILNNPTPEEREQARIMLEKRKGGR